MLCFTVSHDAIRMNSGNPKMKCVFIGGASRSGTTMLGAMLGSHSEAVVTPESQFKFDTQLLEKFAAGQQQNVFEGIARHPRFQVWEMLPNWEKVDAMTYSDLVLSLVDQYATEKQQDGATFWIDHTPVNLRHSEFLNKHYPDCRFIHIVRDGRAVMASQFAMDWGSNDPIFAAQKWIEALATGLACESAYPDRCMRVQYETLVTRPEEACSRICAFLGIDFEPEMIQGKDFDVPVFTKSQHQLVGSLPDPSRIYDWKNTLKEDDIRLFESMTFDLLPVMGYEKMFSEIVAKPAEWKQAWILFKGALQYLTYNAWRRKKRVAREKKSTQK